MEYSPAELPISISPILESDAEFDYGTDGRSERAIDDAGSVKYYNSSDDNSSEMRSATAEKRQRTRQLKRKRLNRTRRARSKSKSKDLPGNKAADTVDKPQLSENEDGRRILNPYKYFQKRWRQNRRRCGTEIARRSPPYASMKTGSVNVYVDKRGLDDLPSAEHPRPTAASPESQTVGDRRLRPTRASSSFGAKLISAFGLLKYPMNLYTAYMIFTQLTGVSVVDPGYQSETLMSAVAENLPNIVDYIPTQLVSTLGVYAASMYRKV